MPTLIILVRGLKLGTSGMTDFADFLRMNIYGWLYIARSVDALNIPNIQFEVILTFNPLVSKNLTQKGTILTDS